MAAVPEPGPERAQGARRQPNLRLVWIDRWAQLAAERPWRYLAIWAIGIGAANLGLGMLLNDRSLARNAPWPSSQGSASGHSPGCTPPSARAPFGASGHGRRPIWPSPSPSKAAQLAGALDRRTAAPPPAGARSQGLWSCPRPVEAPVRRVGRPPGQSMSQRRRLILATAAAITLALALFVGAIPSRSVAP
jgi:hypothetical protein